MTTTRCLSSRELSKAESVTHVLRQKCHPCPGLHSATCHNGPELTDANTRLHPVSDSMGEPEPPGVPSYASRSATKMYRTAPLKGIWQHPPYFHNGTAATLEDVVNTYNDRRSLGLTSDQRADLVQYLKSL